MFLIGHLSKYNIRKDFVNGGTQVAVTGNTGLITTGPHLHLEVYENGKRINPESLDWEDGESKEDMLIRNSKGEISYLSPKGVKHPISGLAYADLFDSGDFIQVDDAWYVNLPVGPAFAGSRNLGALGVNDEAMETDTTE